MDELPDPHKDWDLDADRKLFAALQQFSASFLTEIKDAETAMASLAKDVEDADIRAKCAQAFFRQLANSHYIEQVNYQLCHCPSMHSLTWNAAIGKRIQTHLHCAGP